MLYSTTLRTLALLALLPVIAATARADVILLTNGDRVTGEIVTSDDESLTVATELLGEVRIERSGIASITSDRALIVTLEGGETATGTIATEQEELRITRPDQEAIETPLESVIAIRDDASQAAWEREQERLTNPGWLDFWAGSASLGLAVARGNAKTTTISTRMNVNRVTGFDRTRLNFSQIYSTQSTTEPSGATANRINGSARYSRDITGRLFAFTVADFTTDEFQDLDLRSVLGGGLGWKIIDTERTLWEFGAGGNWNREKFSTGLVRNSGEANFGEESSHNLTDAIRLYQSFSVFPNLSERSEYRLDIDGGVSFDINHSLSWNLAVSDRYLSNPLVDKRANDLLLTTGITFRFAQE